MSVFVYLIVLFIIVVISVQDALCQPGRPSKLLSNMQDYSQAWQDSEEQRPKKPMTESDYNKELTNNIKKGVQGWANERNPESFGNDLVLVKNGSDDGVMLFFIKKTLKKKKHNIYFSLRMQTVNPYQIRSITGDNSVRYLIGDYNIDCKKSTFATLSASTYDETGNVVKTSSGSPVYGSIELNTGIDVIYDKYCRSVSLVEQRYASYCNDRYGFCINYPSYFEMKAPPVNNDGRGFHDGNGFTMSVSGINNALGDTIQSEMNSQSKDFDKITYRAQGKNWFVFSGYKGSNILYVKTYIGEGSINNLYIGYPAHLNTKYSKLVTKISGSFKPGNLKDSHSIYSEITEP